MRERNNWLMGIALGCALLLAAPPAGAQLAREAPSPAEQPMEMEGEPGARAEVLSKLHMNNQVEIRAGELARERGTTAEIRRFGDRILRDHEVADQSVRNLAERLNLPLAPPEARTEEAAQALERQTAGLRELEQLEGEEFDLKFVEFMERTHADAIQLMEGARMRLERGPVRTLVETLLPILHQHHEMSARVSDRQQHAERR